MKKIYRKKLILIAAMMALASVSGCGKLKQEVNDKGPVYTPTRTGVSVEDESSAAPVESKAATQNDSSAEINSSAETDGSSETAQPQAEPKEFQVSEKAAEVMASMTLEEKICQLFIVRVDTLETDDNTDIGVTWCDGGMKDTIEKYPVGGVIYFANNVSDPEQLTKLSADLQKFSKYPLFISIDEEGGQVARIANDPDFHVTDYESMLSVGNTGDTENAREAGSTIGAYLKEYGINLDFAPVADVFTNPDNTVIGDRSFGTDASTVSGMVSACIDGFHEQNVMTCIKHYPGHGDTSADTHSGYVQVDKTWDELKEQELLPFINNMEKTDMIMAAHLTLPNVTDDKLPASLSKTLLTDKLRGELGYNGVIITDALGMGAIANNYSTAEAVVKVINAGADIILMPTSLASGYSALYYAVENGDIPESRIDESVGRILTLKDKYGLL